MMNDGVVSPPIRVVVVDDHPVVREGTRSILERAPDVEVVGEASTAADALRLVDLRRPDVLLLDVHLPDVSGVEVARVVRSAYNGVAVVVYTGHDDAGYARALLQLGVRAYLCKDASGDSLVGALRAVASGRTVFKGAVMQTALSDEPDYLTARENEVLQLIAEGRRNSEIADQLHLRRQTVEFHIHNVFQKLGARSRTEAVAKARQRGLL